MGIDRHLDLGERIVAKDSETCSTRPILIENRNLRIDTPFKIIDGTSFSNKIKLPDIKDIIVENQKSVTFLSSWQAIHNIFNLGGNARINRLNNFLNIKSSVWDRNDLNSTVSVSFSRNPLEEHSLPNKRGFSRIPKLDRDDYHFLLDHIHTLSTAMVLCPDYRLKKFTKYDIDKYIKFIELSMETLSYRNKKPLFAPIQIDMPSKTVTELLKIYKRLGYSNIWLDLKANPIDGSHFTKIRYLLRKIDEIFPKNEPVIYYSHIQKEISPHIADDTSIGSDVMAQFLFADFVGVTRKKDRMIFGEDKDGKKLVDKYNEKIETEIAMGKYKDRSEYNFQMALHKSRLFDPDSYYYYKINKYPNELPLTIDDLVYDSSVNNIINSILLKNEMESTINIIQSSRRIRPYIKSKKAILEDQNLMNHIIGNVQLSTFENTLGNL